MHLTEQDRNEYNNERGTFIGVCPECDAVIDEDDSYSYLTGDELVWVCHCGRNIFAEEAYSI